MNQKNKQKLLPSLAHSRSSPSKCYTDIKSFSFLLFRFIGSYDLIWDPVPDVLQLPLPMKPAHPQCCVAAMAAMALPVYACILFMEVFRCQVCATHVNRQRTSMLGRAGCRTIGAYQALQTVRSREHCLSK